MWSLRTGAKCCPKLLALIIDSYELKRVRNVSPTSTLHDHRRPNLQSLLSSLIDTRPEKMCRGLSSPVVSNTIRDKCRLMRVAV